MRYRTLKKLSDETGIPVSTLRQFIQEGLPHYRSKGGRKIRVCDEEFYQWYRENYRESSVRDSGDIDRIIEDALAAVGCR